MSDLAPSDQTSAGTDEVVQIERPGDATDVRSDSDAWAKHSGPLSVGETPQGALNLNVEGRELAGPLQGFGRLWQKVYKVSLFGVSASPQEVIAAWKAHYGEFWPEGNHFYAPLAGIQPGEVGLINADMPGKLKLSTGVMVLYADDVSFTYMTPLGHPFAGWITFSADTAADGTTIAQVEVLMRAQDPASELGLALGGHRAEDRMWEQTLRNLAGHFGLETSDVRTSVTCVDRKRQWNRIGNLRHDAAMHTMAHVVTAPVRAVGLSWRALLVAAAVTVALAQVVYLGVTREPIPPLIAFLVLGVVTAAVGRRSERAGGWLGAATGALMIAGSVPFIVEALQHPASPADFLHTVFSVVGALGMSTAGVALVRRRVGEPRGLAIIGGVVLVLGVVVSAVASIATTSDSRGADDTQVTVDGGEFVEQTVTVANGEAVFVENADPFHHSFTVDALGLDVELPASTDRRVVVDGQPGTYEFRCAVPGHESMTGTLVVTD